MLLYYYERKGLLILLILISCLIILPRQLRLKKQKVFVLVPPTEIPDSLYQDRPVLKADPLELNTADRSALIAIRGIGPYYASRILRYRERLGGFYAVRQLKEIKMTYFNVDSAAHLFTVNPQLIRKKDLNSMSFKEVLRHPYLDYEEVKLIFNAKNKYKKISFDTLQQRKILPAYKLKKIKPYFR